ncbi:uncharacterized protein LOC135715002 [Ochlerotatus camptorhynchus]|uniref:uncharacterized protein LOC135715002 n=1 Tax=Ochlerotatus camptorhynchus TaxID=644619 RepID=UPI0031D2D013
MALADIGFELLDDSTVRSNIYCPTKDGTDLLRAIRSGSQTNVEKILEIYQTDLNKIKEYIVRKYNWDSNDRIWIRKTIMVAVNNKQCQDVKLLERNSIFSKNLEQAVFILLLSPVDKEDVAVIHPNDDNRLSVYRFIRTVIPNGFLTLNNAGSDIKCEPLIEAAASSGNIAAITRLIDLGAAISLPKHNPLIAACSTLQKETIQWLLTEHFDDFDCTLRNSYQFNAFMMLMQKNDTEMMDFVLTKMITYRQKYYNETESEAFNNIFRCEHEIYTRSSILSLLRPGPVRNKIEEYVVKYQLDLAYQWKGVTMLAEMLYKKLALNYCWAAIRKNPTLLGLVLRQETTIVHECIRLRILDILNEMYQLQPEVQRYFENNQAYETLQQSLWHGECDSAEFILKNHNQFFLGNFDRLKKDVIFCSYHRKSFFDSNRDLLVKYFPTLKSDIDQKVFEKPKFYPGQDLIVAFSNFNLKFGETTIQLDDPKSSLASIRGSNGATLLHYAVEKSSPQLFTNLLDAGCDFDSVDNEGNHPIHYIRTEDMFNFLIENHPDGRSLVHRTNYAGYSVFHKVCQLRSSHELVIGLLEKVIASGANVNQLTNNGESALFMIANCSVLDVLVKHNIKLDIVNGRGETALERYFVNRNRYLSSALLRLTHQLPSFKDHAHKYFGPMVFSNRVHFTQIYRPFLEANPNSLKIMFDSIYEHSPERASHMFSQACCNGQIFIAGKFLDFNYDLDYNYRDHNGQTPIIGLLSCMLGQNDHLVMKLLAKGIDLQICNNAGRNALLTFVGRFTSAEECGHSTDTVQRLLDYGANVNAQDKDGNTALHMAFGRNELGLVDVLVRNGADMKTKNNDGRIPMQMGSSNLFSIVSGL